MAMLGSYWASHPVIPDSPTVSSTLYEVNRRPQLQHFRCSIWKNPRSPSIKSGLRAHSFRIVTSYMLLQAPNNWLLRSFVRGNGRAMCVE